VTAPSSELAPLPLVPGTWTLDAAHSSVTFQIRHLGVTNVRGRTRISRSSSFAKSKK